MEVWRRWRRRSITTRPAGARFASGPDAGDGSKSPLKSEIINGFALSAGEKGDVVEFLKSLTDEELLHDPELADPWPKAP